MIKGSCFSTPIIKHHLADHPLVSSLTTNQLQEIQNNSKLKTLKKGGQITFHDEGANIYLILSGRVKIFESGGDGYPFIKEILKEGDFFGEHDRCFTHNQIESAAAISEKVLISSITYAVFKSILQQNRQFLLRFNEILWKKHLQIEKRYRDLVFLKDTRSRLTRLLLELAEGSGRHEGDSIIVETNLTHQDIASMICSTRVTVTNILNQLREEGEINYSKGKIEIKSSYLNCA